jgi:predicted transcriptional regulator of viral defense system
MPHAFRFRPDIRAQTGTDELIAHLARRQHGVVTRSQLLARGVSRREVAYRIERRRLHVIQRGVYAVGYDLLSQKGVWLAACLTAKGTISHRTAGTAWEILSSPLLEVTASHSRRRPGIRIYCQRLERDEITTLEGVPVTTVVRTVLDLAAILSPRELERALNEAEVRRLTHAGALQTLIDRYPRRQGTAGLRRSSMRGRGSRGASSRRFS